MRTLFKFAATAAIGALLSGCGNEDFTGAYRFKDSGMKGTMVLNVHGDEAELFGDLGKDGIKPLGKMKASVKDEKLLLDTVNSSTRLVMRRNVDERSLDCLNCKVLGMRTDELVWTYDPEGPYDVDQMLKEQARKNEEALNAELEKMQKEALEQARRNSEAQKLTSYEGDWVYQRTTKHNPLTIMGIWREKQIRVWSFKFESMDRLGYETPGFEVTDAGLKIGSGTDANLYTLSADKKVLTCLDCRKPVRWVKADPKKDLSDRNYAREMAGNP
ncbi:hypothetical protein [Pseudomonas anguilliseptica]|uniref:hypothetical protein n=1 Tax=Pseudomonas anguilliseptica TaxID=53406 RepID=UPI001F439185|nr:hypothetical protein [Pseudomonas anguilliseptica]MCE5364131.1 hypothetical protein [Pseudomonas anguilliseptica]